jgi:uncharacterized delta-60 repeat protein
VVSIAFLPVHANTSVSQSANAVAIDSAGDIVVAGYVNSPVTKGGEDAAISATVGRLTPSGSLDNSFGQGDGQVVYTSQSGGYQGAAGSVDDYSGIVEDSSGNILLNNNGPTLVLVGRHADAALTAQTQNTDFSVASLPVSTASSPAVTPFVFDKGPTLQAFDVASAAVLQPAVANAPTSNTILVSGSAITASATAIPLALVNLDGTLDTSVTGTDGFDGTGMELLTIPGSQDPSIVAMAFQKSGPQDLPPSKVVLAGNTQYGVLVVRLDTSTDGLDQTFGNSGVALIPSSLQVTSLAVDPSTDRIVVAGSVSGSGTGSDYGMYELTADGAVDTSFGSSGNGLVTTDFGHGDDFAYGVAIQPDGKIVLAGSATVSGTKTVAALARYTSSGMLDATFGPATSGLSPGLVATDIDGAGNSTFYAVAVQPADGKIVAAGTVVDPAPSGPVTLVARYIGETPDLTGLSPTGADTNGASFTLTVIGDNFISGSSGSQVLWNSTSLTTQYVNATTLEATVPASDLLQSGPASVTVQNPGNLTSNALTFTINTKKTPSITWQDPSAVTYGMPLSSTQLDASASIAGTFEYTPAPGTILHAGSAQQLSLLFTPTDTTDFTSVSIIEEINVNKATPALVAHGVTAPYDGKPHPATFAITGASGDDLTSEVSLTYNGSSAAPVTAGNYSVTAAFPGNSDYNAVTKTEQLVIGKGTPVISWPDPAPIIAGTPLSGTQLNAIASVPGTLTYLQPVGSLLAAGSDRVLSVNFSPTDTSDYESVTAQVSINVLAPPAPPHVTQIAAGGHTKKGLTSITVSFDESMNAASATSPNFYTVFGAVTKKKRTVYTKPVGIRQISYNDIKHTATITLSKSYKGVVQVTAKSGIIAADGANTNTPFVMTAK